MAAMMMGAKRPSGPTGPQTTEDAAKLMKEKPESVEMNKPIMKRKRRGAAKPAAKVEEKKEETKPEPVAVKEEPKPEPVKEEPKP